MNMQDFIAALEAAEGPSRELDFYCARVMGWHGSDDYNKNAWLCHPEDPSGECAWAMAGYPAYTSSIDAALTLVPKYWYCDLYIRREGSAFIWNPTTNYDLKTARHKEIAIAICLVCLKVRAEMEERG